MSMPRRTMLPYPSTSRRQCTSNGFPRITTIALITILFACVYHSGRFLSRDDSTRDSKLGSDDLHIELQPAVEVIKEVVSEPGSPTLTLARNDRPTAGPGSAMYNTDLATERDVPSQEETDIGAPDISGKTREKDLVDVSDANNDNSLAADNTKSDLAFGGDTSKVVERTEDTVSGTQTDSVPAVEKNEQDSTDNTAPIGADAPAEGSTIDSAERSDDTDSATLDSNVSKETAGDEVPVVDKQEEKKESPIENGETVTGKTTGTIDREVLVSEKHSSKDDDVVAEGEGPMSGLDTAEKETSDSAQGDVKGEAPVGDNANTAERTEVDEAEVKGSEKVQEKDQNGEKLDTTEKQEENDAETNPTEEIQKSDREEEEEEVSAKEAIKAGLKEKEEDITSEEDSGTEIQEVDKQVLSTDGKLTDEEEKVSETEDEIDGSDHVLDVDVADKMETNEDAVEDAGDGEMNSTNRQEDTDEEDTEDSQKELTSSKTDKEEELPSSEKQGDDIAASTKKEVQGDTDLEDEEKQELELLSEEKVRQKSDQAMDEEEDGDTR